MKLESIDHICFAVKDLAQARKVYEGHLGLVPALEYTSKNEKIHVVRYYVGETAIEMLEPTEPDSDVGRFLEKRGEGFFLISYRVENVEQALQELKDKGVDTIDKSPRELMGNRYAFIHKPKDLAGILTEILDGDFNMEKEPE